MSKGVKDMLKTATYAVEAITQDYSPRTRPLMKVLVYFGTLMFIVVAVPVMGVYKALVKGRPDVLKDLKRELDTLWYSKSSVEALNELRRVYAELKGNPSELVMSAIVVKPYGKFGNSEYVSVVELLYHYEVRHNNWKEADELCDAFMEPFKDKMDRMHGSLDGFIVNKAKALVQLKGAVAAQEYLLKHMGPVGKESKVRDYFNILRDMQKSKEA